MKLLLVLEFREGRLRDESYELLAFAERLGAEYSMVLIGSQEALPTINGTLYLTDTNSCSEFDPDLHKKAILEAVKLASSDCVVFVHSSYGWDLAPRVAAALGAGQISEVFATNEGLFEVACCNGKLWRSMAPETERLVLTIQAGAFACAQEPQGTPEVHHLQVTKETPRMEFVGYEAAEKRTVELSAAEVIVSAGRGVGKKENIHLIQSLAKAFGGELGASRPIVDAGWLEHSHQVGSTGQVVKPKLYVACGISGAIQHLAGMKGAEFVVAINKDRDAPIGEVADVLVVADLVKFVPALTERMLSVQAG